MLNKNYDHDKNVMKYKNEFDRTDVPKTVMEDP